MTRFASLIIAALALLAFPRPLSAETPAETRCPPKTIGKVLDKEAIAGLKLTQQLSLFTNAFTAAKRLDPEKRVIWIAVTDCSMFGFDIVLVPIAPTEVTGEDGVTFMAHTHFVYVAEHYLRSADVVDLIYSGREQVCKITNGRADDLTLFAEDPRDPSIAACIFRAAQAAHEGREQDYWYARNLPNSPDGWDQHSMRTGGAIPGHIDRMNLKIAPSSSIPDALPKPSDAPEKK